MAAEHITRICECGSSFETPKIKKIFCSDPCRRKYSKVRFDAACTHCQRTFTPKRTSNVRFCSRGCAFENRKLNAIPSEMKAARYAALLVKKRKPNTELPCIVCGAAFLSKNCKSKICSAECRLEQARRDARKRDEADTLKARCSYACKECDKSFIPEYGNKHRTYCSKRCANRYIRRVARRAMGGKHIRKRMRLLGLEYEPINVIKLFERDQWRCQICGRKTPKHLRGSMHTKAPEVDHRIPISKGGGHTWANVQCACRKCNGLKGNRTSAGQLPLFIN